jgi:hypothetical protein
MNNNYQLSSILSAIILLTACAAPSYQPSIPKGKFAMLVTVQATSPETPYVLVNNTKLTFPAQCLPSRSFGNDADKRAFGEAADKRAFGEAADKRAFGEAADKRAFGEAADKRAFGEDADKRAFGEDADKRAFGEDADKRAFGEDADKRAFGEDADKRAFGEDADKRAFGEDADKRAFGEDADKRVFGADQNQYRCIYDTKVNGIYITGFIGNESIKANPGTSFTNVTKTSQYVIFQL